MAYLDSGSQKEQKNLIEADLKMADGAYKNGLTHLSCGVEAAEKSDSLTNNAHAHHVLLQLHNQMLCHINQRLCEPIFSIVGNRQQLQKMQESIFRDVKAAGEMCFNVLAMQARRWTENLDRIKLQVHQRK